MRSSMRAYHRQHIPIDTEMPKTALALDTSSLEASSITVVCRPRAEWVALRAFRDVRRRD